MRLIDADKLSNVFENEMCKGCCAECVDEYGKCNCEIHYMKELLWQQPTAYDVDKVVEKFKSRQEHHKVLADYERQVGTIVEMREHEYAIEVLSNVIDVVRRGGADETNDM